MRKTEKLIVLAVLFAAAIVLALSLNRGGDEVEAADPLGGPLGGMESIFGANIVGDGTGAPALPASDESASLEHEPSLLLNAGIDAASAQPPAFSALPAGPSSEATAGAALSLEPASDPNARILADTSGLRPSFLENYMVYTVAEGDTWSALAQRFYQDGRYTRNLHLANEELIDLAPGAEILVPVFDFVAVDAGLQSGPEADAAPAATTLAAPADAAPSDLRPQPLTAAARSVDSARMGEYEVKSGDTLSDISLAVFGSATRWKDLLDANRDKLQKPESLQVGMKLRIPEGGKLRSAGAAKVESKKPAPKPTTAQSAEKSTVKKKKVL